MRRTLEIVAVTVAALLFSELMMQTPLYRWLQPTILIPSDGAVVAPPLSVQWEGPPRLDIELLPDGSLPQQLGIHGSPFELNGEMLAKPGVYRLRARAPLLGGLIQTERRFVVTSPPPPITSAAVTDSRVKQLDSSLNELKEANDQQRGENDALHEENGALRQENAALLTQIEAAAKAQEDEANRTADQAERLALAQQRNQALNEQLTMMQWQLNAALTCRVWGYYSFPHPQTYPPTRRAVTIANTLGEIFRSEGECEALRLNDPTTASRCFCVGVPWSG